MIRDPATAAYSARCDRMAALWLLDQEDELTTEMDAEREAPVSDEMIANYKTAVERAIPHLPVKNGVVDIDSIWIETSIPYELLEGILRREDLELPENVERINRKSRVKKTPDNQGVPRGSRRRRRKR